MKMAQIKKDVEYTNQCTPGSNLQHLLHVFKGYREYLTGEAEEGGNPYSPGSAQAYSWDQGQLLAKRDEAAK
jgi:hypothetical protein